MDFLEQIDAATRAVAADGEERTVTLERAYAAPVAHVWDACTNPERIPRWFLPVTGELRVGGRFQLEGNAGGTIESCDPPRELVATWEFGGAVSRIELSLEPDAGGGTRLTLRHSVLPDDHWRRFGPGAIGVGWDMAMLGLATHLASGESVDPAEAAAWSASSEGRRFIELSSESWRDAAIAAGEDAAEASAAAERTAAAYAGA
jgi:uncharacterized protein YndB with AHSA1/START domain